VPEQTRFLSEKSQYCFAHSFCHKFVASYESLVYDVVESKLTFLHPFLKPEQTNKISLKSFSMSRLEPKTN